MNDDSRDKSTGNNSILEQLEEVKGEKEYCAFKLSKSGKTSEDICEITTI